MYCVDKDYYFAQFILRDYVQVHYIQDSNPMHLMKQCENDASVIILEKHNDLLIDVPTYF